MGITNNGWPSIGRFIGLLDDNNNNPIYYAYGSIEYAYNYTHEDMKNDLKMIGESLRRRANNE